MSTTPRLHEHIGTRFDDFLSEEGLLTAATETACTRVAQWSSEQASEKDAGPG